MRVVVAWRGSCVKQAALSSDDRCAACLLYTSDAADERSSVDLGGRRIIKKKKLDNKRVSYDTKDHATRYTKHTERKHKT